MERSAHVAGRAASGAYEGADGRHVVVVEDDDAVRSVVSEFLHGHGYRMDSYSNGVAAQRAFSESFPELMIVDRMLPGFSGEELCVCPRAERRSHHHADRA